MEKKDESNTSIIPISSTGLVRVGNSIEITNKIIRESAINFFNRGTKLFEKKLYELAISDFSKAIEIDSDFLDAIFYRGFAKRELALFNESIDDFRRVLTVDSKHIASLYQISYSFCSLKLYSEALAAVNCIIEIDADWHSYMQRAAINKSLGKLIESKLDEEKAWEIGHNFDVF
jgi:tetratricopeptide (TPR) repeat protein